LSSVGVSPTISTSSLIFSITISFVSYGALNERETTESKRLQRLQITGTLGPVSKNNLGGHVGTSHTSPNEVLRLLGWRHLNDRDDSLDGKPLAFHSWLHDFGESITVEFVIREKLGSVLTKLLDKLLVEG